MPNLPADYDLATYQLQRIPFSISQLGASQTAIALKMNANAATSGALNVLGLPMPFAGSIVAVSISMTANKTAGVLSITPTINTTAITNPSALTAAVVANTTKTMYAVADAYSGASARFKAGDIIGCKLTSDGSYAPTTNDVYVEVWVMLENVVF